MVVLNAPPSNDNHAVPLWFLKRAFAGGIEGVDIGPGTIFPLIRNDIENKAVYVDEQGYLSPARTTETGGAERTLGFVRGGKLYLNGMFVKNMSGLVVGKAYWIQSDGTIGTTPVSQENLGSVRVGMAISATDLAISLHIPGGV